MGALIAHNTVVAGLDRTVALYGDYRMSSDPRRYRDCGKRLQEWVAGRHAPDAAAERRRAGMNPQIVRIVTGQVVQGRENASSRGDKPGQELAYGVFGDKAAVVRRRDEDHAPHFRHGRHK